METDRLLLRRFLLSDKEDVFAYAKDPDVGPNAGWKPHPNVEHSAMIIQEIFMRQAHGYAVVDKASGRVIGSINLHRKGWFGVYELGYSLSKDHWGQGLMSEAVTALLAYGFDVLKARRVFAKIHEGNQRSERVLVKQHMTPYKFKHHGFRRYDGVVLSVQYYHLTKQEWRHHAKT
jgi:putative acetyltransferase